MTPRENALLAYRHQPHPSVPNFFTDFDIWDSFGERYFGPGEGKDWFGVSWTYLPEMHSQTETPGQELLEDLEHWREGVRFPNLEEYDWASIAAQATAGWDRENRVSFCMLLNGPFERMMSLMGFENDLGYESPLLKNVLRHSGRGARLFCRHHRLQVPVSGDFEGILPV